MLTIDTRGTHAYPILVLTGLAMGLLVQYLLNTRRGIRRSVAGLTVLACAFGSLGGGLLLTFITSGGKAVGFSSLGGLAGMYAGALLVAGIAAQPYYPTITAQNSTLILPLVYSISKLGCALAGCCRGMTYHGALSVTYVLEDETVTALPVQMIESITFLGLFAFGLWMFHRKTPYLTHYLLQLAMLLKTALDFLRASHIGVILSLTQVLCLAIMLIDLGILLYRKFTPKRQIPHF